MSPLVSIILPVYNAENYLDFTIKSVISQTYQNWDLIIVDDGSSDNSLNISKNFAKKDERIRVIYDGVNKKLPYRLNQLIDLSNGEFIARMDADDIMHPNRLEKQIEFLKNNENYDLVSTGLISIDNKNNVKGFRGVDKTYTDFSKPKLSYPIVHPSVLARRTWYQRNRYSENYPRAEDFDLWTRSIINKDFKMAVLPDLLLFYREEGNLSIDKIVRSYKDILKIYSNYYEKSILNSEVLKLHLKILISKFFYYTGSLQKLSQHRNMKFNYSEFEYYQEILDKVVTRKM